MLTVKAANRVHDVCARLGKRVQDVPNDKASVLDLARALREYATRLEIAVGKP